MKKYDILKKKMYILRGKCKMVNKKKTKSFIKAFKKPIIILIALVLIILVLNITSNNYVVDTIKNKTNLIINNSNVTKDLKHDIYIKMKLCIFLPMILTISLMIQSCMIVNTI